MIVHDCKQGSDRWLALRRGKPTASRWHWIYSPIRRKVSTRAHLYLLELVDEHIHGVREEPFWNQWTRRGQEKEAEARFAFEMEHGERVREVGFIERDDGKCGGSPDGLIDPDGVLEIKVYSPQVHERGKNPSHHVSQLQNLLYLSEREVGKLWSYSPEGESRLRVVERDDDYIAGLVPALNEFIEQLEEAKAKVEHCRV